MIQSHLQNYSRTSPPTDHSPHPQQQLSSHIIQQRQNLIQEQNSFLSSISDSYSNELSHRNSLLLIHSVSGHQPVQSSFQRESVGVANTNLQQQTTFAPFSSISPDNTLPNAPTAQFYTVSYLAQPTAAHTNSPNMSHQYQVTIPFNFGQQLQQSQQQQQQQHYHHLQHQSPPQSMMKSSKVSKAHQKRQRDNDSMVSKFAVKIKTKKSKRNHTLIPNNNIYYPIYRVSAGDGLSSYDTEFLNKFIYPKIEIKKYSTSALDPHRNYITAYEYPVNNLWVIWDYETGWVHLTGIWKASLNVEEANVAPSHMKADIVKLLESTPKEYQHYIKRIRGGFLKIQGTWLPYKLCKILARRFCYYIRYSLVPIFGADFPPSCLKPNERGFGELKLDDLHSFEESALPLPIPQPPPPQPIVTSSSMQEPINTTNTSTNNGNCNDNNKVLPPVGALIPGQNSLQPSPLMQYNGSSFPFSNNNNNNTFNTSESNYNVPLTPPKRHYSSSSSISSISSSVFSGERITPISNEYLTSEIPSFNEMIDIVNASKCLQTLSKDSSSPRNMKKERSIGPRLGAENEGISAILLAAGLSGVSNNHREAVARSSPRDTNVKTGMTINDLLT